MIIDVNNKTRSKIDEELVRQIGEAFLKDYKKKKGELSVAFIGDKEMQSLNKQYRGLDRPTDVLSFEGEGDFLGEILIDPGQIRRQAKELGRSFRDELVFIFVHGLLHLTGYNDETERDRLEMIRVGELLIKKHAL